MPAMKESDRREFLLTSGVFAAGMLASAAFAPAQPQQQQSQDNGPQTRPASQPASQPDASVPGVTSQTFEEAERLAGITFTPAEREMMAKSIAGQLAMIHSRRKVGALPNTLAPAMVFDPRLPGMSFEKQSRPLVRSNDDPGQLPASDEDIAFAPATRLSRWIERKQLSSVRLTQIYLERLKRFDPQLKCVITLCDDHAERQAAQADAEIAAGRYRGPLHGIPWGAKDLLDTEDIRTTWGAEPWVDRVPDNNAAVVERLNEAGAVLVAKLSLGALAYNDIWFGGRTNNPWNVKQGSSGSSAGSAAATAAGLVGFAVGTETYGSITSPCMRCGATGLRPTFGRVSRTGAMALCWSLDKIGPICRTVEDCALVLAAISGYDPTDASSIDMPFNFNAAQSLEGLRLGFDPKWFEKDHASDLDRLALDVARKSGMKMVEIEIPDWPYDCLLTILTCEAAAAFEELTRTNQDDTLKWQDPEAWPNTFRKAWFIPGIEVIQASRFRRQVMQMMADKFTEVDAIITPSLSNDMCLITNNTGHPSLTLRCGFRKGRQPGSPETPYGITLIGRLFDEGTICRVGMALEREFGVSDRRPALA